MPAIVLKLIVIRKRSVVISLKDVKIIEFCAGGRETLPVGGRIADGPKEFANTLAGIIAWGRTDHSRRSRHLETFFLHSSLILAVLDTT
jgi:hypothetical protein